MDSFHSQEKQPSSDLTTADILAVDGSEFTAGEVDSTSVAERTGGIDLEDIIRAAPGVIRSAQEILKRVQKATDPGNLAPKRKKRKSTTTSRKKPTRSRTTKAKTKARSTGKVKARPKPKAKPKKPSARAAGSTTKAGARRKPQTKAKPKSSARAASSKSRAKTRKPPSSAGKRN